MRLYPLQIYIITNYLHLKTFENIISSRGHVNSLLIQIQNYFMFYKYLKINYFRFSDMFTQYLSIILQLFFGCLYFFFIPEGIGSRPCPWLLSIHGKKVAATGYQHWFHFPATLIVHECWQLAPQSGSLVSSARMQIKAHWELSCISI